MMIRIAIGVGILLAAFANLDSLRAEPPTEKVTAALQNYFKAWRETDQAKRTAYLEAGWAEDGIYTDPTAHVAGRAALANHIGEVLASPQFQGANIVQASGVDIHHQVFRFEWDMQDAQGKSITKGMDYGEFNDQGMITKIIGFFGPFPALQ